MTADDLRPNTDVKTPDTDTGTDTDPGCQGPAPTPTPTLDRDRHRHWDWDNPETPIDPDAPLGLKVYRILRKANAAVAAAVASAMDRQTFEERALLEHLSGNGATATRPIIVGAGGILKPLLYRDITRALHREWLGDDDSSNHDPVNPVVIAQLHLRWVYRRAFVAAAIAEVSLTLDNLVDLYWVAYFEVDDIEAFRAARRLPARPATKIETAFGGPATRPSGLRYRAGCPEAHPDSHGVPLEPTKTDTDPGLPARRPICPRDWAAWEEKVRAAARGQGVLLAPDEPVTDPGHESTETKPMTDPGLSLKVDTDLDRGR